MGMGAGISLFLVSADHCCSPHTVSRILEDGEISELGDRNLIMFSLPFLRSN